ncbi:MAG: endonuclease/exonuclease/phosphatase family protein [Friedmanniella sp.]
MSSRSLLCPLATGLGWLGLVVGAATTLARSLPRVPGLAPDTWAMATAFTDFGALAYAVAVVGLGTAALWRHRPLPLLAVLVALALTVLHLSWIAPGYVADDDSPAGSGRVRVLTQNLLFGGADAAEVVRNGQRADVVVLTEVTRAAARGLARAGIAANQPYESGGKLPQYGAMGTRVYSRFPIRSFRPLDPAARWPESWLVDVEVPDIGTVTVAAVHPPRPVPGASGWAGGQELVHALVPRQRTIVAGDFNAVDSHPSLRRFRADGFRDCRDIVGAGWQPTYPAQGRVPPLIAIDHILVSPDLTATASATVQVTGSDHRGVTATVALRG